MRAVPCRWCSSVGCMTAEIARLAGCRHLRWCPHCKMLINRDGSATHNQMHVQRCQMAGQQPHKRFRRTKKEVY